MGWTLGDFAPWVREAVALLRMDAGGLRIVPLR
jgi:hypothetical protein